MHPTEEALNAYAEGSLTAGEAAEIEQHLGACVACRQLVDDLREILRATADLDLREPPVRVWPRIERAIQLERVERGAQGDQVVQPGDAGGPDDRLEGSRIARYRRALPWLAAAAALVLATVVGLRYAPSRQTPAPAPASGDSAQGSADAALSVESELRQAEAHYENAIKGLE